MVGLNTSLAAALGACYQVLRGIVGGVLAAGHTCATKAGKGTTNSAIIVIIRTALLAQSVSHTIDTLPLVLDISHIVLTIEIR